MISLLGKNLRNDFIWRQLTMFYGIGRAKSYEILKALNIAPRTKTEDLGEEDLSSLSHFLREKIQIESLLRNKIKSDVLLKVKSGSYSGLRHKLKLPVRGQRTSTNARTVRRLNRRYE